MTSTNWPVSSRPALAVSTLLLLITHLFPSLFVAAQIQQSATLTVKVTGERNAKGEIGVALFQQARGFPEDSSRAVRAQDADLVSKRMTPQIVFRDLAQGIYAISVGHEENSNGKLDKNFFGVPKEGYGGASNNPKKKPHAPTSMRRSSRWKELGKSLKSGLSTNLA